MKLMLQIGIALCAFQITSYAADEPIAGTYTKEAWCYDQRGYGVDHSEKWLPCKKKVYDTLAIERRADGLYNIRFSFVQFATTAGTCELEGIFKLDGAKLVVSESDTQLREEGCAMEIEITPGEFEFHDPRNSCSHQHCGRNQNIDGEAYPRRRTK